MIDHHYLIFDDSTPFHLKILDAIPDEGKIQIGPDNAKNTIIEFFDYYCGYCKKIHPELIDLAKSNNDFSAFWIITSPEGVISSLLEASFKTDSEILISSLRTCIS